MNARHGVTLRMAGVALLLVAVAAWGTDYSYHKVASGVSVFLGIVPAEIVRGHPREHPESEMHGGAPEYDRHVMVALFDEKTGERITGAEVTARVSGGRASSVEKRLEPMVIAGSLTYGNYFPMLDAGPYQIELRIYAPGSNKPIHMRFEWSRS